MENRKKLESVAQGFQLRHLQNMLAIQAVLTHGLLELKNSF